MSYQSDLDYPRRVVVDDTDPRVQYAGGTWNLDVGSFDNIGIFGAPYNHTMHGSNQNGASFSFEFEGEYVQVRGAKDNRKITFPEGVFNDNKTLLAKWTCQVDGSAITHIDYRDYIYDITNNVLCEQGHLSRNKHILTVNVTIDDPNTQMFWLDKVEYVPVPSADLSSEVLKYDGSDPSIVYSNSSNTWKDVNDYFNGTGTTGSSVSFDFNGTQVSLYGFNEGSDKAWLESSGRYYIDNSGDTTFKIPAGGFLPNLPNNRTDYNHQLLFTTSNLQPGTHEMVITYTGVQSGSSPSQWLNLDYFYVTSSKGTQINSTSTTPGNANGSDGSNSPNSTPTSVQSKKSNTGAIVGGVVGGLAFLALIGIGILLFLRLRRKNAPTHGQYDAVPFNPDHMYAAPTAVGSGALAGQHPILHPQGLAASASVASASSRPSTQFDHVTPFDLYSATASGTSGSLSGGPGSTSSGGHSSQFASFAVSNTGSSAPQQPSQNFADLKSAQRNAVSTVTRQHADSGIRYPQAGGVVDIPPSYTES